MNQLLICLFVVFSLSSCDSTCEYAIDLKESKTEVKINRLEKELFETKSPKDIESFIKKHPALLAKYMGLPPIDTQQNIQRLYDFYTNKELKGFYMQGEKINNNFPDLNNTITNFYKHVNFYYPSYYVPEVNTIVSGLLNTDYFVSDSLVVVSIDYFYGKHSKHRPDEFQYMLDRREAEYIVPGLALRTALLNFVERSNSDERLIADMVNWGKVHYFMERMMPCAADSTIIMYSGEQLNEVEKNMEIIWGHFIENKLFYEVKPDIKRRYVEESPKVSAIGEKCPGRIGRYIGWQIVKSYMDKNPEVTLQELMKEQDALKIFKLSKYKPKEK